MSRRDRPSERTSDRIYSPTTRGDRPEQEPRRTDRTDRTETLARPRGDRPVQQPPTTSPGSPGPSSASTVAHSGRTLNPEDPYPVAQGTRTNRTNEYFVPQDGIDREVVTADICRYLGNDALVRPGRYENPQTGQVQDGYYITAYRNLTSEMIADLKSDSQRWQLERRQIESSRGNVRNADYLDSYTHRTRQHYGPSLPTATPGHQTSTINPADQQAGYAYGAQHQYAGDQMASNYAPTQAYASERDPSDSASRAYYAGAPSTYPPQTASRDPYYSSQIPLSHAQSGGYTSQPVDARGDYYATHGSVPSAQAGYNSQQREPRTAYYPNDAIAPAERGGYPSHQYADGYPPQQAGYSTRDAYADTQSNTYDNQYQNPGSYAQAPVAAPPSIVPPPEPSRRDRERDSERQRQSNRRR